MAMRYGDSFRDHTCARFVGKDILPRAFFKGIKRKFILIS